MGIRFTFRIPSLRWERLLRLSRHFIASPGFHDAMPVTPELTELIFDQVRHGQVWCRYLCDVRPAT